MTSHGRKSIDGGGVISIEGRGDKPGEGELLVAVAGGVGGREYGEVYCAIFKFGDGGLDMSGKSSRDC